MAVALPFLFSTLPGCREQLPTGPGPPPTDLQFRLPLNSYYGYDNWEVDYYGYPVSSSEFRTSWKVLDTGVVFLGYEGVTIVVDSIFAHDARGIDSLALIDYRYFRSEHGDVFEFGFIARLLQQRDSVAVPPKWDRLFSSSAGANTQWAVELSDSLGDGIYAIFYPSLELLGTTVNNIPTGLFAYHVEIIGQALDIHLWISDSPSCILRVEDDSNVEVHRMYQRLSSLRSTP